MTDYYPYSSSPSYSYVAPNYCDSWMPYDLLDTPRPFVHKPITKEARMALKRKRKQVKNSRKKNR